MGEANLSGRTFAEMLANRQGRIYRAGQNATTSMQAATFP
ncbi:hypothetical protein J2R76_000080 [Bradyrhizobium sp. USDA 4532]|nr:hypothetical protein [Bradyrhizobium sp. USDA 4545]MCP1850612.1 hypothetical protein [Bradyrhizobium sp. USDA 4541]MCP1916489.1 hypothetical protein [Bradyrhizobium sp. USDA 4532]